MGTKIFVILLFLFYGIAAKPGKRIPNFAGPYRVIVHRVSNDSSEIDSTGDLWTNIRTTHYKAGQKQYGWGRTFSRIPFDDSLTVVVHMASRSNNQWKRNAFVLKFERACYTAQLHAQSLFGLIFGDEAAKTCPIPPGDVNIKNRTFEITFPKFPVFPYGHWLFTLALYHGPQVRGFFVAEAETVPKL